MFCQLWHNKWVSLAEVIDKEYPTLSQFFFKMHLYVQQENKLSDLFSGFYILNTIKKILNDKFFRQAQV